MTTSFKFHFRPSSKGSAVEGKLFIRVICMRRYKNLPTCYPVFPSEWDAVSCRVVLPAPGSPRFDHLRRIDARMRDDLSKLRMIVSLLESRGEYGVEDVLYGFRGCPSDDDLLSYCERTGRQLHAEGRPRTARAYRSSVRSLIAFNGGHPLKVGDLDAALLNAYEESLIGRGLQLNTISFYMRNLRAIYKRAVREGIIPAPAGNPFHKVYTGVCPTVKRALSKEEMNALAALENLLADRTFDEEAHPDREALPERTEVPPFSQTSRLLEALLYFMFCFHARGMSYVDLAYLRKSEVHGSKIIYARKKSGRQLEVKVTAPMRRILDHFLAYETGSPYVFPVIDPRRGNERLQYESGLRIQNLRLNLLARMAGLEKRVTTHVCRHSWATIAKGERIDIAMISEALGHSSVRMTAIYLDSFGSSRMDLLSDKISGIVKKKVA